MSAPYPYPDQGYQPPGQHMYPPPQGPYPPGPGAPYAPPPGMNVPPYHDPNAGGYAPPPGMNMNMHYGGGNGGAYPQPPPINYQPVPQGYPPPQGFGAPPYSSDPYGGGGGMPITSQPGAGEGWMPAVGAIPNCPPGLEYLTTVDQLFVKQKVELLEAIVGFETNNKFTIKNAMGQKVFWAAEDNDCCTRNCCGPARPFDMKIMDATGNQVIHLYRPLRCDSCCFPCCLQQMEISSPPGNIIGTIEQNWSIFTPDFSIKNASGETVLKIEGPLCTYSICGDVEFKLMTLDGQQVGKISKQWSGLARELFTDADFFGISFPIDLDVRMKAVMLGACFLIDAMFFEKSGNAETDRPGMF